jgi:hypothetical protein
MSTAQDRLALAPVAETADPRLVAAGAGPDARLREGPAESAAWAAQQAQNALAASQMREGHSGHTEAVLASFNSFSVDCRTPGFIPASPGQAPSREGERQGI